MNNSDTILSCKNLTKIFTDGITQITVLNNANLEVTTGSSIAITGASGSGKTTLLQLLGGLDEPTQGQVFLCNHDLAKLSTTQLAHKRNQDLGFIYQFHHLLMEFSAVENVAMPLLIRKLDAKQATDKAKNILDKVGLAHRFNHKPAQLSGGERARVAIARALVTQPACVLADEPTGNLDRNTAEDVFNLMLSLQKDLGISFVIVTHEPFFAERLDKQYELKDGQLYLIAKTERSIKSKPI